MTAEENDPERRFLPEFDTALGIRSKKTRAVTKYWQSKRKGQEMPSRADNEPTEIPTLLPYLALIDVELNPRRLRWRLVGTHITGAMGNDYTRFYFDEKYSGPAHADLIAV
ncbi:MAG: PAS domain-containing protein [Alphaproteobacteria bacterium]